MAPGGWRMAIGAGARRAVAVGLVGGVGTLLSLPLAEPAPAAAQADDRAESGSRCRHHGAGTSSQARARCGCLLPPPPPPPPIEPGPRGRLTVRASHEARVYVDGSLVGMAPVVGLYLDAGRHQLRLVSSCGELRRAVRIPPGQSVVLSLATCPSGSAPPPRPLDG